MEVSGETPADETAAEETPEFHIIILSRLLT